MQEKRRRRASRERPIGDDEFWKNRLVTFAPQLGFHCAEPTRFRLDPIACGRAGARLLLQSRWTVCLMRRVCTNRRLSTWLALAAMTLQLALSFGHIHLEKLASGAAIASVAATKAPSSQQNPVQHPANETDDFCAICATIHLASTSFLPDAPLLPVPFATRTIEHFSNVAFIFVSPQRAAFQARAPPLA
jgi:hypothetical protein